MARCPSHSLMSNPDAKPPRFDRTSDELCICDYGSGPNIPRCPIHDPQEGKPPAPAEEHEFPNPRFDEACVKCGCFEEDPCEPPESRKTAPAEERPVLGCTTCEKMFYVPIGYDGPKKCAKCRAKAEPTKNMVHSGWAAEKEWERRDVDCYCACHDTGDCEACGCHIVDEVAMERAALAGDGNSFAAKSSVRPSPSSADDVQPPVKTDDHPIEAITKCDCGTMYCTVCFPKGCPKCQPPAPAEESAEVKCEPVYFCNRCGSHDIRLYIRNEEMEHDVAECKSCYTVKKVESAEVCKACEDDTCEVHCPYCFEKLNQDGDCICIDMENARKKMGTWQCGKCDGMDVPKHFRLCPFRKKEAAPAESAEAEKSSAERVFDILETIPHGTVLVEITADDLCTLRVYVHHLQAQRDALQAERDRYKEFAESMYTLTDWLTYEEPPEQVKTVMKMANDVLYPSQDADAHE
jgi:hypothetical protein